MPRTESQPAIDPWSRFGCDWKWVRNCRLKPAFRPQWNAGFSRQPRSAHPHLITRSGFGFDGRAPGLRPAAGSRRELPATLAAVAQDPGRRTWLLPSRLPLPVLGPSEYSLGLVSSVLLTGGRVIDPAQGLDGVGDVF